MVGTLEPNHFEGEDLLVVVGGSAEVDRQVNASEGSSALPWHNTVEGRGTTSEP